MNVVKINKKGLKIKILIAPLDWGLGHATRCIPIIKLLINLGAEVIIAADGPVAALLQNEFPACVILPFKGYQVSYSRTKKFFFLKMIMQFRRITSVIKYEKNWLQKTITEHNINGVISDNRFGFHSDKVPCVFITHQLFIDVGTRMLNRTAQKINYRYINKFSACWVPDAEGNYNLAGRLSHPEILPAVPVQWLGPLSRFTKRNISKDIDLLIMISGPEPQRSIFEKILLKQAKHIKGPIVFLRGLPVATNPLIPLDDNITIYNHLPAKTLNEVIQRSKLVVARCGYSTIMDLETLKQKAILIPTPGQREQQYLAGYLKERKIFYTIDQKNFSLQQEIENAKDFEFAGFGNISLFNETVISTWLNTL